MEEKKISTSIEILIRVADFESIRIAKYAEKKIVYETNDERIKKEDEFDSELVGDIVRCMRGLPDKLGKKTITPVAAIEEKIVKKIPEWLANNPIPNLAKDSAEKGDMQAANKIEAKKEKEERNNSETSKLVETKSEEAPKVDVPVEKELDLNDGNTTKEDNLFDDDDLFK